MTPHLDKEAVREAMLRELDRRIHAMTESVHATREGATHEESRPENDKDTRGLEASYLARGQAQRVVDLESDRVALQHLDLRRVGADEAIEPGALVEIEVDGEPQTLLLALRGGGLRVEMGDDSVQVVTPSSPVGASLVGARVGESFELRVGGRRREYEIVGVC